MKHAKGNAQRQSIPTRVSTLRSRSTSRILRSPVTGLCGCPFRATQRYPIAEDPLLLRPSASDETIGSNHQSSSKSTASTSSSACQWSAEEIILAKQRLAEQSGSHKFGAGLPGTNSVGRPHGYLYQDYGYEFGQGTDHNPSLGRSFGHHTHHPHHTHHGKMGTDPTILLTLARWARLGASRLTGDDDQVDRLNYQITSLILLLLVTLTGMRQYLSHLPLQCWIPQEFSRSWEEYAEHYCWVTNTYFADLQARLPGPNERPNVVRYYQWATFMLALQAFGFILPCFIWRLLQNFSGFHVQRIMQGAMQVNCSPTTAMAPTIGQLGRYMDAVIYHRHYKLWRQKGLHEWCKLPLMNLLDSPQPELVKPVPQPVSLTQPTSSIKSVHFQQRSSFTLPSRKRYNDEEALNEVGFLSYRKSKKCRAPSPPVSSKGVIHTPIIKSLSMSSGAQKTSKPDRQPLTVEEHSSPKATPSTCCTPGFCSLKRITTRRSQAEAVPEKSSRSNKQSEKLSKSSKRRGNTGIERPIRRNSLFAFSCCFRGRPSSEAPLPVPSQPSTIVTCGCWKGCCKTTGTWLAYLGRLLGGLICLIPGCLCHWPSCCQGNKLLKQNQAFLFYLYVTVKLFYVVNLIGQIYFMKLFLGADSYIFGFMLMRDLVQGHVWQQSGNFPRVTYCEFEAKKLGKNYKYTLQCVLPLNLFLEKVYVFLWFWMALLTILTTYSLLKWLCRLSIERHRIDYVRKYVVSLKQAEDCSPVDEQLLRVFTNRYLEHNGLLLLWLIATNAGEVVAAELTSYLWDTFIHRVVNHGDLSSSAPSQQHRVTFNTSELERSIRGQVNLHGQPPGSQPYLAAIAGDCLCRYPCDTSSLSQANPHYTVRRCACQLLSIPHIGSIDGTTSASLTNHAGDQFRLGINSSLDSIV